MIDQPQPVLGQPAVERFVDAEEAVRAIRAGEVDAVVAETAAGDRVFTLRSADHAYRVFIEQMNQGAATLSAHGDLLYCNQAVSELLDFPLERLLGQSILSLVTQADRPALEHMLQSVAGAPRKHIVDRSRPQRNGSRGEFELLSASGEAIPVYLSMFSFPEDSPAVCVLITDLRESRTRERLRQSEANLRAIAQTVPDVLFTCDARGAFDYVSPRFADLTGIDAAAFLPGGWTPVLHPDDLAPIRDRWAACLSAGIPFEARFRVRIADGSFHWFLGRCRPIRDAGGSVIRWFGCATEVHDLLLAEEALVRQASELNALATELGRSNRDLEDFAHIVGHDLTEPLRGIRTLISFIIGDSAGTMAPKARDTLNRVEQLAGRMQELLDALLNYARAGSADLAPRNIELNVIVAETLAVLRPRLDADRSVVEIEGRLPTVCGDRILIRQVFANLVSNALKYNDSSPKRVVISARDSADGPVICVTDNGIGIAARDHDAVFGIFRRLHPRDRYGGGTGAGLAIVKKIIERHAGRIWIESSPGQGSTFCFTLSPPAVPPPPTRS